MQNQNPNLNKKTTRLIVIAFLAGVVIGANWPKIRKALKPYLKVIEKKTLGVYAGIAKFLAGRKEGIEDLIAETQFRKKIRKTKARTKLKRTLKRKKRK